MIGIDAYPLAWPDGWKRTLGFVRRSSAYQVDFTKARNDLAHELRKLSKRPQDVVISTNIPSRRDGLPYANAREPADPGVAVYWISRDGQQRVIACDAWRTVRENLRAVGLAVKAMRDLERTKASEILDRAYSGFAALPPSGEEWAIVLGLHEPVTEEDISRRYRELAMQHHPDRGGDPRMMAKINAAREAALKGVSRG